MIGMGEVLTLPPFTDYTANNFLPGIPGGLKTEIIQVKNTPLA